MESTHVFNNRWSLGFAFGVIADKLIFLFDKDYLLEEYPGWVNVFWVMLMAIQVGFSSYPFFVCLSTSHTTIGAVFGFLYTAAWLGVMITDLLQCPQGDLIGEYNNIIINWPSLVCYLVLLGQFAKLFIKGIRAQCGLNSLNEDTSFLHVFQAQYVQQLLRKPPLQEPQKSWIRKKLYKWDPYFQYPSRIISTAVLIIICLYMYVATAFIWSKIGIAAIRELVDDFKESIEGEAPPIFNDIKEFIDVFEGVWIVTMILSTITCVSYVFNFFACYRKHMKLLREGKKYLLVPESMTISPSLSVVALGKFTAWQVAYILWGLMIMQIVQLVFGMILMYVLILPMVHGEWMKLLNKWGTVILTFFIVLIIKKLQLFIAGRFFLQPKISPEDKEKPLALDNRKIFVNFSYFLFFHSVVVGLTSCLFRLLRGVVLGAWLVGRIDRPVMPKGFEEWDNGFKTWIQMLFLDHYHTNPILVCFCYILGSQNREKQQQESKMDITILEPMRTGLGRAGRAKTRWLLFYTLFNNPSLQKLRKQRLGSHSLDCPQHYSTWH